jgi:hypothetical protein
MRTTSAWVSFAPPCAASVVAQAPGTQNAPSATTSTASGCPASLITSLCDYPDPETAVALGSKTNCWKYCNPHEPCDFVIFAAGNFYTGMGTCWLYPEKTFDASPGSTDCGNPYLSVYSKSVYAGGSSTTGASASTATPSPVASVCGYPHSVIASTPAMLIRAHRRA